MAGWLIFGFRWAARVTGLLVIGLVLLLAAGEGGPPNVLAQPGPVQLEFAGIFLMLAGFLIGWRWEVTGGLTAVAGFALFLATELAVNGRPPGGAIPLFLIPAVLLLLGGWLARWAGGHVGG